MISVLDMSTSWGALENLKVAIEALGKRNIIRWTWNIGLSLGLISVFVSAVVGKMVIVESNIIIDIIDRYTVFIWILNKSACSSRNVRRTDSVEQNTTTYIAKFYYYKMQFEV